MKRDSINDHQQLKITSFFTRTPSNSSPHINSNVKEVIDLSDNDEKVDKLVPIGKLLHFQITPIFNIN